MNMDINTFKLAGFVSGLVLFLFLESIFGSRPWKDGRGRRLGFHLGLSVFNSLLLRFPGYLPLIMWVEYVRSRGWGAFGVVEMAPYVQVVITVIVFDWFDYVWHRANHEIRFLWRFHKVHHVDTHVDVTTSMRFHPGELAISYGFKAVWIIILGPSLEAFVIFECEITLAAQFHHTNIDLGDRAEVVVRSVFVTPRFHAAHHTVCKRTGDNNYATILVWWDRLFGTYREPDYGEMEEIGLATGGETYLSFGKSLAAPFGSVY